MASVQVECPGCNRQFMRTVKQINVVIKRSGVWRCVPCVNRLKSAVSVKPNGTVRLHKRSGYLEEKHFGIWRRQHILVMEAALGCRIEPGHVVHHINGVKTDNRIENLRVMTIGEHTIEHHTGATRTQETKEKLWSRVLSRRTTKLSEDAAEKVRRLASYGAMSQRFISELFGVSVMTVNRVINNKSWRKQNVEPK